MIRFICNLNQLWHSLLHSYTFVPNTKWVIKWRKWYFQTRALINSRDKFGKLVNFTANSWNAFISWWRHEMEIFFALIAICAGNSPVTGEFSAQRPVTRSFDVFCVCDLRLNKRLSKQSWGWWFKTLSRPLWRYRNVYEYIIYFQFTKVHSHFKWQHSCSCASM